MLYRNLLGPFGQWDLLLKKVMQFQVTQKKLMIPSSLDLDKLWVSWFPLIICKMVMHRYEEILSFELLLFSATEISCSILWRSRCSIHIVSYYSDGLWSYLNNSTLNYYWLTYILYSVLLHRYVPSCMLPPKVGQDFVSLLKFLDWTQKNFKISRSFNIFRVFLCSMIKTSKLTKI